MWGEPETIADLVEEYSKAYKEGTLGVPHPQDQDFDYLASYMNYDDELASQYFRSDYGMAVFLHRLEEASGLTVVVQDRQRSGQYIDTDFYILVDRNKLDRLYDYPTEFFVFEGEGDCGCCGGLFLNFTRYDTSSLPESAFRDPRIIRYLDYAIR